MIRSNNPITDEMLAAQRADTHALRERLGTTAIAIAEERDRLRAALLEIRDIIEDHADVTDGGPLGPNPNHAMRAMQIIDAALGKEQP